MLVEASRALEEGIVRDPGDVDMGLILGIGFPPFRGGILRWADTEGLDKVVEKLGKYESLGKRFQPTEQMRKLATEKKGFYRRVGKLVTALNSRNELPAQTRNTIMRHAVVIDAVRTPVGRAIPTRVSFATSGPTICRPT